MERGTYMSHDLSHFVGNVNEGSPLGAKCQLVHMGGPYSP